MIWLVKRTQRLKFVRCWNGKRADGLGFYKSKEGKVNQPHLTQLFCSTKCKHDRIDLTFFSYIGQKYPRFLFFQFGLRQRKFSNWLLKPQNCMWLYIKTTKLSVCLSIKNNIYRVNNCTFLVWSIYVSTFNETYAHFLFLFKEIQTDISNPKKRGDLFFSLSCELVTFGCHHLLA